MSGQLYRLEELSSHIRDGRVFMVAGSYHLLTKLPRGNWIGGLTHSFYYEGKTVLAQEYLYAFDLTDFIDAFQITTYHTFNVANIYHDQYTHGFTLIILPAFSHVQRYFALNAYIEISGESAPLCGWIAGVYDRKKGLKEPLVVDGTRPEVYYDRAVVLHASLPYTQRAVVEVLCPFAIDLHSDVIKFEESTYIVHTLQVNDTQQTAGAYWQSLIDKEYDGPMMTVVRDFPTTVEPLTPVGEKGMSCAAPVIPGLSYYLCLPCEDRMQEYINLEKKIYHHPIFCCFCSSLYQRFIHRQKQFTQFNGIFSMGEVGSFLYNMVGIYLSIVSDTPNFSMRMIQSNKE